MDSGSDVEISVAHRHATAPIEIIAALGMAVRVDQSRPQPLYLRGADAKQQQGFAVPLVGAQNSWE